MRNVIIVGSGCAGNTAAIYAARANLKPLVVGGHEPGGQLSMTTLVENFPGFPEGVEGPVLVENIRKQAEHFGAEFLHGSVIEADLSKRPFRLRIDHEWQETRTLIIASGASARWLNLPNEQRLIGHGVSSCATCDGFFHRGKKIMVIGGGDSAMEEANFLTRFGSEVSIVHRRDQFRASKIMLDRARNNPKIRFLLNTVVEDIYDASQQTVTAVKLCDRTTSRTGSRPSTASSSPSATSQTPRHSSTRSSITATRFPWRRPHQRQRATPATFSRTYRQAITASGAGCMAAIEVERFLEDDEELSVIVLSNRIFEADPAARHSIEEAYYSRPPARTAPGSTCDRYADPS
jgi:thioredoxin reductase (NADPH)